MDSVEQLPGYDEFVARRNDLSVVLRDALPKSDLSARIRTVGAKLVGLENPAIATLSDPDAPDDAKALARKVVDAVAEAANEVAELLVDLAQSKEIVTVVDGRMPVA